MNLSPKSVERVLAVLKEYRTKAEDESSAARRRGLRADFRFHEGRSSAFLDAIDVLWAELELGDKDTSVSL